MGRWVTSKGRRIYIPDEGEEVSEKYKKNVLIDKRKEENQKSGNKVNITEIHFGGKVSKYDAKKGEFGEFKKQDSIGKDEDAKEKQIASNKSQADERNKKSEKNTLENRNKLKKKIDDYVKAHPNPTAEDRRKVSEMRDKYDAMKKEAYVPIKKEQREKIAIIQNVKKNTVHRKQAIKDIYYKQELELYEKRKKKGK